MIECCDKDIPPFTVWYGNQQNNVGISLEGVILDLNYKDKNGIEHEIL
jgi:hypothetical protein